jgi:hypothetical protein
MSYTLSMYNTCVENGSAKKVRSGSQAQLCEEKWNQYSEFSQRETGVVLETFLSYI